MSLATLLPPPVSDMGIRWTSRAVVDDVELRLVIEPASGSHSGTARLTVWSPPKHDVIAGSPCIILEQHVGVGPLTPAAVAFERAVAALDPIFSLSAARAAAQAQQAEWSRHEW